MEFIIKIPEWFLYTVSVYMTIRTMLIIKEAYKQWLVIRQNKKELDGSKKNTK